MLLPGKKVLALQLPQRGAQSGTGILPVCLTGASARDGRAKACPPGGGGRPCDSWAKCPCYDEPASPTPSKGLHPSDSSANGRNVNEILRLLIAMQTSDEYKVATPANWRVGEDVIIPPPGSAQERVEKVGTDYRCLDWFLCLKK